MRNDGLTGLGTPKDGDMKRETVEMASQAWAPRAPSLVQAVPKRSLYGQPPSLSRGVGGYNHRHIGEEVVWRPVLLSTNPCHFVHSKVYEK